MQKSILFIIVALVFSAVGFSFAKYCPIGAKLGPSQAQAQAPASEPQTKGADPRAPLTASAVTSTVQTVQTQIALYRVQHDEDYPNFKKYGWKQMTFKTNTAGQITENDRSGTQLYGPYFQIPPTNPLIKSSEVLMISTIPQDFRATGSYGFVFAEDTGKFFALTAEGKIFEDPAAAR